MMARSMAVLVNLGGCPAACSMASEFNFFNGSDKEKPSTSHEPLKAREQS